MSLSCLLVANRGEIAVRILRAAAELGIGTVTVFSEDDATSLHTRKADDARPLRGTGATAYLDADQMIAMARETGCDAIHPGYGFLSESAAFARRCAESGITFVGPRPEILDLFGDKTRARALAERLGVPVLPGTSRSTSLEEARAFFASLGEGSAMMIKAVAGGGGRGVRAVHRADDIADAYERCQSEARSAFGNGDVYVERLVPRARHVEVQVVGDGSGEVSHTWERDCTIQRRYQKVVEIAPSPWLSAELRDRLTETAVRLAAEVRYDNIGTFEFLVDMTTEAAEAFAFIEANARLQVEHTVTEEVTGIDLVKAQLQLAGGRSLSEIGLRQASVPVPRGFAMQLRINAESMDLDGTVRPAGGTITAFEAPSGPGIRVDSCAYAGYTTNPAFDPLLAKLVAHTPSPDLAEVVARAYRALCEFRIEGVATNVGFLQNLLRHPAFIAGRTYTRFVEDHAAELVDVGETPHRRLYFAGRMADQHQPGSGGLAGVRVDPNDPLAVLRHGKSAPVGASGGIDADVPAGTVIVRAPMHGTIVAIDVREGDLVRAGQQLFVMEALKMEHVVATETSGRVQRLAVALGDSVFQGHALAFIEDAEVAAAEDGSEERVDLDRVRPDLEEVRQRHAIGLDAARPDAVARRRATQQRTARENIDDLCDPDSFIEYGPLVIAAQRRRRPVEELIERTPADGLVAGIGSVNGDLFDESKARCIAMSYDYTVLAGTQGQQNHRKKDRMFELAETWRLPIVFFTEGGGGRPGDTDGLGVAGLDCLAFNYFGKLSGLVPLVGITSGRCFAGNAALLGCCDVVIATKDANIGMGGPAMVEGGGLGVFRPDEIGPVDVQAPNGVIDVLVEDEAAAVQAAKQYLSYFQGAMAEWSCPDQRLLRSAIPENRRRSYDVRSVIDTLADGGSVLELRRHFGRGMVTALVRIEGRPLGLVANNPMHLSGAIDSDGADKAARFMQLCDAFDLPLLFLCDTPGIMVGPDAEKTALVRHASRMFVTGASVSVPLFTIILRKAYGLGAQAMAGGSFKAPVFTVSWPTGEFGGMGLEGAVKLGYRNELAAIEEPEKRKATYEEMVERMYAHGKATNTASHFEIDDVIDPVDSRRWVTTALRSLPPPPHRDGKKRPSIDTW
jgi:acetyl/propionyl-CoA carboxylase alpha subunit/acetyl-CoA carboxylase carboxyltransferase component